MLCALVAEIRPAPEFLDTKSVKLSELPRHLRYSPQHSKVIEPSGSRFTSSPKTTYGMDTDLNRIFNSETHLTASAAATPNSTITLRAMP